MTAGPLVRDLGLQRYKDLDAKVDRAEGDGLAARWTFGREMLKEAAAHGGRMPHGRLEAIVQETNRSRAELQQRLRAAREYSKLPKFLGSFRCWNDFVNPVHDPAQAHNSGDNEWYTPEAYIEAAREVMGGIDLDPASTTEANAVVRAARFYTADQDGLSRPWKGCVWLNPPYAADLVDAFMVKLRESYTTGDITAAITLTNNSTETDWWVGAAAAASALCLPNKRVKFWHPRKEATPLQGQAILYFGKSPELFVRVFQQFKGSEWLRA